jgi:hypothetical protein
LRSVAPGLRFALTGLAAGAVVLVAVLVTDGDDSPAGPARLVVRERHVERQPAAIYIEGAESFLRIRSKGRPSVRIRRRFVRRPIRFDGALPPGRYAISSYVRACAPACDRYADPPSDACATEVVLEAGARVAATVLTTPTHPCRIEIDRG